jgi:hypothetical protein
MKEPTRLKLTNNPSNKKVQLIPLTSDNYDMTMIDDVWTKDENNSQDNSQSIQQLESESSD